MSDSKDMEIGRLQARQDATDGRLEDLEESMEKRLTKIEGYLQEIRDAANMGKGAWWLMLKIGGSAVVIGGVIHWAFENLPGRNP